MHNILLLSDNINLCFSFLNKLREYEPNIESRDIHKVFHSDDLLYFDIFIVYIHDCHLRFDHYIRVLHSHNMEARIIIISQKSKESIVCAAFENGADDFIEPPVSHALLKLKIKSLFR